MNDPSGANKQKLVEQLRQFFDGPSYEEMQVNNMMAGFSLFLNLQLTAFVMSSLPKEAREEFLRKVRTGWKKSMLKQNTAAAQNHEKMLRLVSDPSHLDWALGDSEDIRVSFMKTVAATDARITDIFNSMAEAIGNGPNAESF
jgi:hypothetical protein